MNDLEKRRSLVQAAISAPIIATIPCGAALANASAHQCITQAAERTAERGLDLTVIRGTKESPPSPDEYLRVSVPVGKLKNTVTKEIVVKPCYMLGEEYYDAGGNKYSGLDIKFEQFKGDKGTALVLIVFRPNEEKTSVELVGVWPDAQLDVNDTAMNGSCWTSVSPNTELRVMT